VFHNPVGVFRRKADYTNEDVLVAWNADAGNRTYDADSSDDLFWIGDIVDARWHVGTYGGIGILCVNGFEPIDESGTIGPWGTFVPITGVVVTGGAPGRESDEANFYCIWDQNNDYGFNEFAGSGTVDDPFMGYIEVSREVTSISVSMIGGSYGAAAKLYSDPMFHLNEDAPVSISMSGESHAYIKITSENGLNTTYFHATVTVYGGVPSQDAHLISVAGMDIFAGGEMGSPAVPKTATIAVPYSQLGINATHVVVAEGAKAYLYSDDGYALDENKFLSLIEDVNHIYIKVIADDDTTTLYYDVTVTREPANAKYGLVFDAVFGFMYRYNDYDGSENIGNVYHDQDANWVWNASTRTLTLNGFTWRSETSALTIMGDCNVVMNSGTLSSAHEDGISTSDNVNITITDGEITAWGNAIVVGGNNSLITVRGGKVRALTNEDARSILTSGDVLIESNAFFVNAGKKM